MELDNFKGSPKSIFLNSRCEKQPGYVSRVAGVVRGRSGKGDCTALESGFEFRPAPYQLSDLCKLLNFAEPHLKSDNSNTYFPGFYF